MSTQSFPRSWFIFGREDAPTSEILVGRTELRSTVKRGEKFSREKLNFGRAESLLRSSAPSGSRGLAKGDFHPFGSTLMFSNDEVTRVVTCFARVVANFAGIPKKILPTRVSIWCIFTVKIRGTPIELTTGGKTA